LKSLDYGKFLVLPVCLFAWGLKSLSSQQKAWSGSVGRAGANIVLAGYVFMAVTTIVALWPLPWGIQRDEVDWQAPLPLYSSILNNVSSLVVALGMIFFAIGVVKAKVWPWWLVLPLNASSLAAVPWLHETLWGGLTGLAWLILGCVLFLGPVRPSKEEL
jgi:hypothetical protein